MMRRYPIVKLADDLYTQWVGPCDAPSGAYTRAEVVEMLHAEVVEAEEALVRAKDVMSRLEAQGHTYIDTTCSVEALVSGNRAGPGESELTFDELCDLVRGWQS